ncbi:protein adenylyltransferase SelO [Aliidiomarina soli]|uniref:Protein nucleotidyltransferase YdiU n=1 Tax=Aliidiomarina soli TaxID=1928574 RepID=A0A432WFG1_9GAMM|nr:YdiU family protein [Aliidiomarina soli]RUO32495.1 YdiU family protein [Aliidiomarina soli]
MTFKTTHSYLQLPESCFQVCQPTPVADAQWIAFNQPLAASLALPETYWLTDEGLDLFSGNKLPEWAQPVSQAYAGHQFGHFVPQLGDGRALLLAEFSDEDGQRFDVQLKGSGPTPYSRGGDGRSPLGPVLREYLLSEYMARIGVPTTRALAAVATGESVQRETAEPGAILTRVASSHLRVGSFQFLLAKGDLDGLERLADYTVQRHYPQLQQIDDDGQRYLALLDAIIEKQAQLVTHWMSIGFIHGVMNTDNTSLSGETIDYGPCAFIDEYRADQVFSFIDKRGRYAYNQQPAILHWNMARLAECLLPLIDNHKETALQLATDLINAIPQRISAAWLERMGTKLGLNAVRAEDKSLIERLLQSFEQGQVDFTLGFYQLADELNKQTTPAALYAGCTDFSAWRDDWQQRLSHSGQPLSEAESTMRTCNVRRIPRNHQIQAVIEAAYTDGDLRPFNALHAALQDPFATAPEFDQFDQPPADPQRVTNTFCGT